MVWNFKWMKQSFFIIKDIEVDIIDFKIFTAISQAQGYLSTKKDKCWLETMTKKVV